MVEFNFTRRLITGVLLFVLLSEWMRPLALMSDSTGIYRIEPLLFTLAALIAIDVLSLHAVLAWLFKIFLILSLPTMLYEGSGLLDMGWLGTYSSALRGDIIAMAKLDWQAISPELRTFAFVLSWAVVASCLFHAVQYKRFVLWFTAGTAVYLVALDGLLELSALPSLIRATAAGLLLHAFLVPYVLQRIYNVKENGFILPRLWPLSAIMLTFLMLAAGLASFKQMETVRMNSSMPVWQSFKAFTGWGDRLWTVFAKGKTGYGENDTRLGGSLQLDDTPVFLTVSELSDVYWRGAVKTIYDGKGWHTGSLSTTSHYIPYTAAMVNNPIEYIYWLTDFKTNLTGSSLSTATFQPLHNREAYLQLPSSLPERVVQLTAKITEPYDSSAEKAAAIERFLRSHYPYTLDPPAQSSTVDFVDSFLFEQQAGYCDYFSTAMAVMLRTVGIPSRWVKGFAPGQPLDPIEHAARIQPIKEMVEIAVDPVVTQGNNLFYSLVRNSNAHSWVEAYIPEKGWVAFEPTPPYTSLQGQQSLTDPLPEQAMSVIAPVKPKLWRDRLGGTGMLLKERIVNLASTGVNDTAIWIAFLASMNAVFLFLLFRSRPARIRLLLLLYSCGLGQNGADHRLLERILHHAFRITVSALASHETMREAALRVFPPSSPFTQQSSTAWDAVLLYEQLRFGPTRIHRLPARQMRLFWKSLNKIRMS